MTESTASPPRRHRRVVIFIASVLVVVALVLLCIAAFPVGMLRSQIERRLSHRFDAPVSIASVTRDTAVSFSPLVSVRDMRIGQPAWAGQGDFVRVRAASLRVPVFALLLGRFSPDTVRVDGLRLALIRDRNGKANWQRDRKDASRDAPGKPIRLRDLIVTNASYTLLDDKRGLSLAGPVVVNGSGLRIGGKGRFRDTPATFEASGGRIVGVDPAASYPFTAVLTSRALRMSVKGIMDGTLNTSRFTADARIQAPTLKNFDRIIEAGLFGTQPIDLAGTVRHAGRDWFVDRLAGSIGRTRLVARADILKRDGRTAVSGDVHASQFDFDDLSDTEGLARGAALKARTGPRILPTTRINLSKIGQTDVRISFAADRLLARDGTVFRALKMNADLDHRRLTISNIVATLASGRVTGQASVDHRTGRPKLALDLRFDGATLDGLIGQPDIITGRVRGRVALYGQGDTVRAALAQGSGKAAMVATQGEVKRLAADVLGQNLSGAIGHAISGPSQMVPLRCMIADFRGRNGVFAPRPLAIETDQSVGRGAGRIFLDGERINLLMAGATRSKNLLRIADPIRIGGTLSVPRVSIGGMGTEQRPDAGKVLKIFGRSIGRALGLSKTPPSAAGIKPETLDCASSVAAALR